MKNNIIVILFLAVALCGCRQNINAIPATSTLTTTPLPIMLSTSTEMTSQIENTETPRPTLIYTNRYPTVTPSSNTTQLPPVPTITAPPPRNPSIVLPSGLGIEEYQITQEDVYIIDPLVYIRHSNRGGWHFWPTGGIIGGKLFQAKEASVNNLLGIRAFLDKDEVFSVGCGDPYPLITAWTYGQNWIIQSRCHQQFDIFWNGVSLNSSKGYQSSFAFQILGKRPFYLFQKDDQIWVSYDNQEVLLGYDEVNLRYCCEGNPPPMHYENLITFYATKKNQMYYVAIGLFDK